MIDNILYYRKWTNKEDQRGISSARAACSTKSPTNNATAGSAHRKISWPLKLVVDSVDVNHLQVPQATRAPDVKAWNGSVTKDRSDRDGSTARYAKSDILRLWSTHSLLILLAVLLSPDCFTSFQPHPKFSHSHLLCSSTAPLLYKSVLFCSRSSKNIGQISQDLTPYPDMRYLKCHTSSSKSSLNGTTEKYKYQKHPQNLVWNHQIWSFPLFLPKILAVRPVRSPKKIVIEFPSNLGDQSQTVVASHDFSSAKLCDLTKPK